MGRTSKKVNPLGTFTKRLAREPLLAAVHSAWSTLDEAGQEASSEASALELLSGTTVRSNALRVCATVAPRGLTPVPELGSSGLPLAWSSRASDAHRSTSCRTPPRTRCITPRAQLHRREASTLHIRKCPSLAPRQRSCGGALHTSDASVAPPPAVRVFVSHGCAPRQRGSPPAGNGGAPGGGRQAGTAALRGSPGNCCALRHPLRVSHRLAVVLRKGAAVLCMLDAGYASLCPAYCQLPTGGVTPPPQVHGRVSTEPAVWVNATVEEGLLTEVLYEKSQGEGIAKVSRACRWLCAQPSAHDCCAGSPDHHQPATHAERVHSAHRRVATRR